MFRHPPSVHNRRAQIGSPIIAVNASGAYLRHRAAAARAHRARRRSAWRVRLFLLVSTSLLYLAIGRDLALLARSRATGVSISTQKEVHDLTHNLEALVKNNCGPDAEPISPLAFTSAASLVNASSPDDLDSLVSDKPISYYSRAE